MKSLKIAILSYRSAPFGGGQGVYVRDLSDALKKIEDASKKDNINLLEVCVEAAINKCTVGEMTESMEKVFGRHTLSNKTISGVYGKNIKSDETYKQINIKGLSEIIIQHRLFKFWMDQNRRNLEPSDSGFSKY